MSKHTPTPWHVSASNTVCGGEKGMRIIAHCSKWASGGNFNSSGMFLNDKLNAERIVKCVNAHDELVAALRELKNYVLDENAASTPLGEAAARAMAVLAKLEGGAE